MYNSCGDFWFKSTISSMGKGAWLGSGDPRTGQDFFSCKLVSSEDLPIFHNAPVTVGPGCTVPNSHPWFFVMTSGLPPVSVM